MNQFYNRRSAFGCLLASAMVLATVAAYAPSISKAQENPMSIQKQQVVDLLKSIETGEAGPGAYLNAERYKQHNLSAADGVAGLMALLQQLPKGSAKIDTVRVFQDGDYVFAHTEYNLFGPKIGFDIFKFEGGKIVEHWDNLQETAAKANPSGRTMIDGSTQITDLDKTESNKALVRSFADDILLNGRMEKVGGYIDADNYTQHNPGVADGLAGLGAAMEAMAKAGVAMKYDTVHKVLGEGNFVLTVSEGTFLGKHSAFYDLFRVANGKIVEHWDVIETIPPRAEWKNENGKF